MENEIEIETNEEKLFLELPNKKYQIIYADPPWKYDFSHTRSRGITDYKTLSEENICKLAVKDIAEDNSILLLWVTFPKLDCAINVMEHWGFKYTTMAFTWVKTNSNSNSLFWGMGNYTRSNPEICLLGKRGAGLKVLKHNIHSVVMSPVKEHSKKPVEIKQRIKELFGDVSKIELFARDRYEDWVAWGDQLSSTVQKTFNEVK